LLSDATARKCGEALPGQCSFDVATLQCQAGATAACLTPAKVTAIQKIQRGPSDSAGHALYSPWTQGGEAGPAGWRAWMLGTDKAPGRARAFVEDWMRYVAVLPGQKPIDWARFDYDSDPARIAGPTAAWQADGTDYSAFARRGGRILFYQGTADPAFSAIHLMRNLEHVPDAASFSRLFLVPGMAHCSGGQAFDRFDPLSAIVDWVEKGQAPSRMIATGAAFPGRSTALCAIGTDCAGP
jgi:feruloyl esterase